MAYLNSHRLAERITPGERRFRPESSEPKFADRQRIPGPFSSKTYVDQRGLTRYLGAADFALRPLADTWTSPSSGAVYPIRWQASVPALGIAVEVRTAFPAPEVTARSKVAPSYWEGAIDSTGKRSGQLMTGRGYLEMTGYDRPVEWGP